MIGQCDCRSHKLITSCSQISRSSPIFMPFGSIMVALVVAHSLLRVRRRRTLLLQGLRANGWHVDVGMKGSVLTLRKLVTTFTTATNVTTRTIPHLSARSNSLLGTSPSFSLSLSSQPPLLLQPSQPFPTHTTHSHDSLYTVLAPIHSFRALPLTSGQGRDTPNPLTSMRAS